MTAHPTPRSTDVTLGKGRAPARAMLRAMGLNDDDMVKPQIGAEIDELVG
jgi:dihydroxy-acid dehydratase